MSIWVMFFSTLGMGNHGILDWSIRVPDTNVPLICYVDPSDIKHTYYFLTYVGCMLENQQFLFQGYWIINYI